MNRRGYLYNSGPQVTQQTRTDSGYVEQTYDDGSEFLTSAIFTSAGIAVPAENFDYAYDASQNLVRHTNNAAPTAYLIKKATEEVPGSMIL